MSAWSACPHCTVDTAGNHASNCPSSPTVRTTTGWACPRCGKTLAPHVSTCCGPRFVEESSPRLDY